MDPADTITARFLEELQGLDAFRARYKQLHPWVPMEKGDPDLRHLVEALAYYSARAHVAMERSETRLNRRLFAQYFPYLLTPQPAFAVVEAKLRSTQVEATILPRGTELQLTAATGASARFVTRAELRVLPVRLSEVVQTALPGGGAALRIRLLCWVPRNLQSLGKVRLYVSHLEDFWSSLEAWMSLRKHLVSATIRYGQRVPDGPTLPCTAAFGEPSALDGEDDVHPLEVGRALLHFPEQELFFDLGCPPLTDSWQVADITLVLDDAWPKHIKLGLGSLHLHAVPVVNGLREHAQPIEVDGSRRRWPLRYPDQTQGMALQSTLAVYRTDHNGLIPLRPGVIAGAAGGFEVDPGDERGVNPQLVIDLPEAFTSPVVLTADARWYQPDFSDHLAEQIRVHPFRRSAAAVELSLVGAVKRHQAASVKDDARLLAQVLALRMKPRLDLDEVRVLLSILGREADSPYRNTLGMLSSLVVRELAVGDGQHLAFRYTFNLAAIEAWEAFKAEALLRHVYRLLDAWIPGAGVEVEGISQRLGLTMRMTDQ